MNELEKSGSGSELNGRILRYDRGKEEIECLVFSSRVVSAVGSPSSFLSVFLKQSGLKEINSNTMEQYKSWLFNQSSKDGWFLRPNTIVRELENLRTHFERMKKEGELSSNPLSPFYKKQARLEMQLRFEQRRKGYLKVRQGSLSDQELLNRFLEYARHQYCHAYFRDIERMIRFLIELAKSRNKSVFSLRETDFNVMRKSWFDIELHPSLPVSDTVISDWSCCLKLFYRWAYEEGYHDTFILKHWNQSHIKSFIQFERERRKKEIQTKARRYSLKEILRSYWLYLKETYNNYGDWKKLTLHLNHFIRFLVSRGENVYTVTEKTIADYKQVLFNHEYQPACFYTAYFQAERIRAVKRFFDWFTVKGYSVNHPLKTFGVETYRREIEPLCQEREQKQKSPLDVSEQFVKVYQGVLIHEKTLGLAKGTLRNHEKGWRVFFHYLDQVTVENIRDVDEEVLNDYQVYVSGLKNEEGEPLSVHTRTRHLVAVKKLFAYLARFKFLPRDPSGCIELPKNSRGLPTTGMNDREVKRLLLVKEPASWKDIRDRALLETLYSTGMRSNELRNLKVEDVDFVGGLVRVNVPKGGINYQRVVPIGKTACFWIQKYLKVRKQETGDRRQETGGRSQNTGVASISPHISGVAGSTDSCLLSPVSSYLFLTQHGKRMSTVMILNIVKSYLFKSGIKKNVVTHSFRVSCATEMLKHKADIKFVQQQLGHTSIQSTEKYLRLVPGDLKKVHTKTHPREKGRRGGDRSQKTGDRRQEVEEL